jgi:hypothetical protein
MARYASGKKSVAISDRSGFKVRYSDLKTTWDGLRVEKEEWEPKHPQLTPAKNVVDATALFQPRADNDPENIKFFVGYNYDIFQDIRERPSVGVKATSNIGSFVFNFGADSGVVVGTGAIGTVVVIVTTTVSVDGVAGTGAIGTSVMKASITEVGVSGTGAIGIEIPTASITEEGVAGTGAIGTIGLSIAGWGQSTWGQGTWGD